jgi:predicted Zn finger-like uncharacterized protein
MRLTCPNCSARYEVDDAMVGADGRDVQCANCGTTWFQPGRRPVAGAPRAVHVARNAQVQGAEAGAAPAPRPGRDLAPAMREILRQEAEREARLRRAAAPVETQSEMPLETTRRPLPPRPELDAARDAFDADAETPASRRDLLPDIEEINSTLRATGDRSPEDRASSDVETLETARRRRRGVRLGFLTVLILSISGVLVYDNTALVIDLVPEAEPLVRGFVDAVNTARFRLDDLARNLAERTGG